ncbi:lysophospholipase L1 and related esterase [Alkalidesulfovibrio alkalitolerans DSM 16529]|jgi:acyl-CoA thioesterase-1|uniref:Lysophospholipase L1 and related esterase n=1 Tax=Alkalidesulfovibrio alkalitolerans DSM 16529 TaxID=1121439 RepID=S7TD05_9BACT|nr:lysophospholipase L1 and related esterase [Alkalidesulfovibrio alkalitolerans DSM 16529]
MSVLFATGGDPREAHGRHFVLTCLGDSLTAGFGLRPGQAYPDVLERLLREEGYDVRVINAGVSGDTSAGGLSRLGWALREQPDAMIVALGANDGLRGLSTRLLESNLDAILSRLASEQIPVLLAGMKAPRNLGAGYADSFEAVYRRLAERRNVLFLPFLLEGVAADPSLNLADGIHPNARGAEVIAQNLLPLVRELLAQAEARDP